HSTDETEAKNPYAFLRNELPASAPGRSAIAPGEASAPPPMGRSAAPARSASSADTFQSAHIAAQRLGHGHAAVGLLVVLQHRDQGPADGQPGTVEGVHQFRLAGFRVPPTGLHAACLEVATVGAGGNFPVF